MISYSSMIWYNWKIYGETISRRKWLNWWMFVNVEIKLFYGNLQHVASNVYQGLRIQNIAKIWLWQGNILFELTKYVSKKTRFHILVVGSKI
jgi:hypothetical protein